MIETDYLVIGSGLAGLTFALRASAHGRVVVATKRAPADANTAYAQGGVAGALDPDDGVAAHVEDTLRVGDGLCHRDIVEICAREGPEHILWLANELGVPFDRDAAGHLALGREGGTPRGASSTSRTRPAGRSRRRCWAGVAKRADRITLLPDHLAIDLLTTAKYGGPNAVFGAYLLDQRDGRGGDRRRARGRAGHRRRGKGLPLHHQPRRGDRRRRGDGLPGRRAVANMEFFQFHPTCCTTRRPSRS